MVCSAGLTLRVERSYSLPGGGEFCACSDMEKSDGRDYAD
jgi:hypothetical protein